MLRTNRLRSVAFVALAALLGGGATLGYLNKDAGLRAALQAAQADKGSAEDEQAIRKAVAAYSTAFEKGNLEELLAQWAADAEYIDESGKMTKGRDAIAALIRKNLENLKGHKMKLKINSLRFLSPEVALEDGTATHTRADGAVESDSYTAVWLKSDGKWLVHSVRDLPQTSEPESPSPARHLKPLEWLIGDWVSSGENPQVHLTCRWTTNQSFLLVEYRVKGPDKEFTTTQRFGWDPVNEQIRSWYFDSMGGFGEAFLNRDGNHWVAEATGVLADGRTGYARNSMRFVDEKSWVWQSRDRSLDGRPIADIDVHFVRKQAKE